MATSEVDFQDQVGQVTRNSHCFLVSTLSFILSDISGNIKSSSFLA
ncbi:MAG: hypothetical protein ACOZBL_02665 [Patescibacteria group bacterium]